MPSHSQQQAQEEEVYREVVGGRGEGGGADASDERPLTLCNV